MVEEYRKKGGHIIGEDISADSDKENKIKNHKNIKDDDENNNDLNNDDSDSDYDVNKMMKKSKKNEISDKNNSQTISEYIVWILYKIYLINKINNKIYLINKRFNVTIFVIYR